MMDDDCKGVLEQLQVFLDHECSEDVAVIVSAHLAACGHCHGRADFERHIRAMIAATCRDAAPAGLLERVQARLTELG